MGFVDERWLINIIHGFKIKARGTLRIRCGENLISDDTPSSLGTCIFFTGWDILRK